MKPLNLLKTAEGREREKYNPRRAKEVQRITLNRVPLSLIKLIYASFYESKKCGKESLSLTTYLL